MTTTYESSVASLVDHLYQDIDMTQIRLETDSLYRGLRELFTQLLSVPIDTPLILYAEQADPPIVKNLGKALLAEVLKKKIGERGANAKPVHMVLYDDIFGSNSEVLRPFIPKNYMTRLSRQTYAFAPVLKDYAKKVLEANGFFPAGTENAYGHRRLGEFNIELRNKIEQEIFPFCVERLSLSNVEYQLIARSDLFKAYREFLLLLGQRITLYASWQAEPRSPTDSGIRRYLVSFSSPTSVKISDPLKRQHVADMPFDQLLADPHVKRISLNNTGRGLMIYLLAYPGIYVTGGGSQYNSDLSYAYSKHGFRSPLLTYINQNTFIANRMRPAGLLRSKKGVIYNILEDNNISTTYDLRFGNLVESPA